MAVHLFVMNRTASFILALVMISNVIGASVGKSGFSDHPEIDLRLKQLNKPAIKSIESPDGDIIDCVSITDQPALDHPLLKNHTIQIRPSFYPRGVSTRDEQSEAIAQLWHVNGECPDNTIPIRRTTKQDLLRAYSFETYGKKNPLNISKPQSYHPADISSNGREHAIAYVQDGRFRGAKARINLWKPRVQEKNEFSLSQIWVLSGSFDSDLNSLEAGWQVSPRLYGDNNPRLFGYWTIDAYQKTGCYNHMCPGFVQVNKRIALGATLNPISTYAGSQFEIYVLIWKEPKTGNWWLQINDEDIIGYWPSAMFPKLRESATIIEWGGEVVNSQTNGQHTSTEMGSGHFAEEGFRKASYVRNLQVIDMSLAYRDPQGLQTFVTRPSCYNVKTGRGKTWGTFFHYGGPGRNPQCP